MSRAHSSQDRHDETDAAKVKLGSRCATSKLKPGVVT